MKAYYEFVHLQRNDTAHEAHVIENKDIKPGIHMTMAMYLYSTMISITDMEASGIIDGKSSIVTLPETPVHAIGEVYQEFKPNDKIYGMAAEAKGKSKN
jgi:hypothetical protein